MVGGHAAPVPQACIQLARLSEPPNTSELEHCSAAQTAQALATMLCRIRRRREKLSSSQGAHVERLLSALRRLESTKLRGYHLPKGVLLSEPFGAVMSVVSRAVFFRADELVSLMLGQSAPKALISALAPFGEPALRAAVNGGVRIGIVPLRRSFAAYSRSVAALVPDIDHWQAPPAGLFVLEERLLLLRHGAIRMAAAHEFAHALDAVLANNPRSYLSFERDDIRQNFARANGFVNQYAASGLDEYFAECMRAYVEVNDDRSSWLPITRQDLFERDPRMFATIEEILTTRLAV